MEKLKTTVDKVLGLLCIVLFSILVVDVVWQVFTRLVLHNPSTWSEAAATFIFVWLGFLGAAYMVGERGHMAVEFIVKRTPLNVQRIVGITAQVIVIAFAVLVLGWGGTRATTVAWLQEVSGLPITVGPLYMVMPLSAAFMVFYGLYNIWDLGKDSTVPDTAVEDELPEVI
ncbi:MAG: TRAP transporter small permease [Actinomycetaceae bacterium]|nr:TRAP transporter small permease [Actinomycetaceae bacterium]